MIARGDVPAPSHIPPGAKNPRYKVDELDELGTAVAAAAIDPADGYCSISQLAARLCVAPITIQHHLKAGRIDPPSHRVAGKVGHGRYWDEAEADEQAGKLLAYWAKYGKHPGPGRRRRRRQNP
jgi:hypothetical protein